MVSNYIKNEMPKLKLEVFESDKEIKPISFYVYKAVPNEQVDSIQQFMRNVVWKILYRQKIPAFTDDKRIFTLTMLLNLNIDESFTIEFEQKQALDIQNFKKIYADVTNYYIKENLKKTKVNIGKNNYPKYSIKKTVSTAYISELKTTLSSNDKQFRLRRNYKYNVKISDENKIQLWLKICSEFETKKTIYDFLNERKNVEKFEVKNCWGENGETGIIQSVGPETVADELQNFKSLKQYWEERN